jgi:hypothetical protein
MPRLNGQVTLEFDECSSEYAQDECKWFCWFCGEEVDPARSHHYVDKENDVPHTAAHAECVIAHIDKYYPKK